jgi:hypothetical protein
VVHPIVHSAGGPPHELGIVPQKSGGHVGGAQPSSPPLPGPLSSTPLSEPPPHGAQLILLPQLSTCDPQPWHPVEMQAPLPPSPPPHDPQLIGLPQLSCV